MKVIYKNILMSSISEQITQQTREMILNAAASFWQVNHDEACKNIHPMQVIKVTPGKILAVLPAYSKYPSAFLKIYRYDRGFQNEITGLRVAEHMPALDGIRFCEPLCILADQRAIVSEQRQWRDTSSEWIRFFVRSQGVDWRIIGNWLRRFHDSCITTQRNDYFLRKKFEKIKTLLEAVDGLISASRKDRMNLIVSRAQNYFNTQTIEWVISHGDFGLDNIKFAGAKMEVIDFEDSQMAPREFDLVNFLTRMEFTGYFPHRKQDYGVITREFLAGYGRQTHETPIKDFFYLLIKLEMIESYYRRRNKKTIKPGMRIIYKYFETQGLSNLYTRLDDKHHPGETHA